MVIIITHTYQSVHSSLLFHLSFQALKLGYLDSRLHEHSGKEIWLPFRVVEVHITSAHLISLYLSNLDFTHFNLWHVNVCAILMIICLWYVLCLKFNILGIYDTMLINRRLHQNCPCLLCYYYLDIMSRIKGYKILNYILPCFHFIWQPNLYGRGQNLLT